LSPSADGEIPFRRFFLQRILLRYFSLCALCLQRKSGQTIFADYKSLTAAPLSANALRAVDFAGLCPTPCQDLFGKRSWISKTLENGYSI